MKTEAVRHAAFLELAQEDDVLAHLLDRNMEVLHAVVYVLKVIKFMVMCSEQRLRSVAVFMDILHDCAGYGHTVVGRSSASDLVQKHQRTGREVVQDHGCLEHLDHECGLSAGDVVRGTHACEYLVAVAEGGFKCRYI